jgi:hypothetical protein
MYGHIPILLMTSAAFRIHCHPSSTRAYRGSANASTQIYAENPCPLASRSGMRDIRVYTKSTDSLLLRIEDAAGTCMESRWSSRPSLGYWSCGR